MFEPGNDDGASESTEKAKLGLGLIFAIGWKAAMLLGASLLVYREFSAA